MDKDLIRKIEEMMHQSNNREYDTSEEFKQDFERGYRKALREVLKLIEKED